MSDSYEKLEKQYDRMKAQAIRKTRNSALEEAALAALKGMNPEDAAVRIRALKETPNEG